MENIVFVDLAETNLQDEQQKQRLIDIFLNSVYVYDDKVVIMLNYKDGEHTVTIDTVESAVKKENTHHNSECSTSFVNVCLLQNRYFFQVKFFEISEVGVS